MTRSSTPVFDSVEIWCRRTGGSTVMIGVSSWSPYGRHIAPPDIPIVVYGTRWCAATQTVRRRREKKRLVR